MCMVVAILFKQVSAPIDLTEFKVIGQHRPGQQ